MGFIQAIKSVYSNYANFSGRASRSEFWYFFLFSFIISFIMNFIEGFFNSTIPNVDNNFVIFTNPVIHFGITILLFFTIGIPSAAVSCRRLYDVNKERYWLSPYIISVLLSIVLDAVSLMSGVLPMLAESLGIVLGIILLFYMPFFIFICCKKGTQGSNRFGDDPLANS